MQIEGSSTEANMFNYDINLTITMVRSYETFWYLKKASSFEAFFL